MIGNISPWRVPRPSSWGERVQWYYSRLICWHSHKTFYSLISMVKTRFQYYILHSKTQQQQQDTQSALQWKDDLTNPLHCVVPTTHTIQRQILQIQQRLESTVGRKRKTDISLSNKSIRTKEMWPGPKNSASWHTTEMRNHTLGGCGWSTWSPT